MWIGKFFFRAHIASLCFLLLLLNIDQQKYGGITDSVYTLPTVWIIFEQTEKRCG